MTTWLVNDNGARLPLLAGGEGAEELLKCQAYPEIIIQNRGQKYVDDFQRVRKYRL